jgi:hypothetical protein
MITASALVGTWKLKSYVVVTATGLRSTPLGENPRGYLTYTPEGRMQVIGAAHERSIDSRVEDPDRVPLGDGFFAYAGTYTAISDTVIHHVEISWNDAWTGTDQVRNAELSGNTLRLSTCVADPIDGTETRYALIWEKVVG